jgi:hypothetical protein
MKSLQESCDQTKLHDSDRLVVVSAPHLQSILGAAIIAGSCYQTGRPFHITFVDPFVNVEEINALGVKHAKSTVLYIGTQNTGKKRLRKGKGYPLFIGCDFSSIHEEAPVIGNTAVVTAAAYVFASKKLSVSERALGLAGLGTISNKIALTKKRGAHQDLLKKAINQKLIEARKGFKVYGVNSVPLSDAFLYSINPYLPGISGNSRRVEQAFEDSGIPFPKRKLPITSLTNKEAQKLTQRLIQHIPAETIPDFLGQDYVVVREDIASPVRFHSSLKQLARLAWIRGLHGSLLSVLLGDRARQLRSLLDTQMFHSREVIRAVQRAEGLLEDQSTPPGSTEQGRIIDIKGVQNEILPDVGQIVLDTGPVDESVYFVMTTESYLAAVWRDSSLTNRLLDDLRKTGLGHRLTASNAVEVNDVSESTRDAVILALEKTVGKG